MTIEERLEKLELELAAAKRLTRRLMAGAGLVLGIFVLYVIFITITWIKHVPFTEKIILANAFVLKDEKGEVRARLAVTEEGPGLCLFDDNGAPRAMLAVTKSWPGLIMPDYKGETRRLLSATKSWPEISTYDDNGELRSNLAITKSGPWLNLYDEKGKVLWQTP